MGDEDCVDQVKMEDDGVMALGGGWWVKSRRKAKASSLAEVGHTSTSGVWWFHPQKPSVGFGGFVLKTISTGFGGFVLKTIGGGFTGLGLKTRAEVPRRDARYVVASGSSCRGESTSEEARWPSDEDDTGLDHIAFGLSGLTQLYPGAKLGLCNSPVK
jgi:hypothetical protein